MTSILKKNAVNVWANIKILQKHTIEIQNTTVSHKILLQYNSELFFSLPKQARFFMG